MRRCSRFCGIDCGMVSMTAAQETATRIDLARDTVGSPPSDFEFQRTGEGELGEWKVVLDPTAVEGLAIEHLSTDQHEDRFPLAIYKPLFAENIRVSVRLKIVSGVSPIAGIAVSLRDPDNYYAVSLNTLEQRADLFLFSAGKSERIDGVDAEVLWNHWHSLRVIVHDDHFAVSLESAGITSSASASSVGGTSMPNILAVCRLMLNSNLTARRIGKSAGFSPLSTRPT
jgi:hypothetical protein